MALRDEANMVRAPAVPGHAVRLYGGHVLVLLLMVLLTASCVSTADPNSRPSLEAYSETLIIGKTTRAEMESRIGAPEKEVPQRGGVLLVWETRTSEDRTIGGSGAQDDRRMLEGNPYGFHHTIVRTVTLSAIYDENNILRKKQLLAP